MHRSKGLGKLLIEKIMKHPPLRGFKTLSLRTTEESRKLYEAKGFKIVDTYTLMEINDLEIYSRIGFFPRKENLTEIEYVTNKEKVPV